ncbi:MAG: MauE/DoxX family redox-associated membrane protein, partial [Acidimicrobiales bacterium]
AELALGLAAITIGGALLWWAVAASYVAFAAFVLAALRKGTMIGTCGCFGREETPPHWSHVGLNGLLAGLAALTAVHSPAPPVEALVDQPGVAAAVLALSAVALSLLYAAYVELPRTRAASGL